MTDQTTNVDIGAMRWGYREARAYRARQRALRLIKAAIICAVVLSALALALVVLRANAATPTPIPLPTPLPSGVGNPPQPRTPAIVPHPPGFATAIPIRPTLRIAAWLPILGKDK
jgi:hypothetical protein